jgi:ABC-type multidrug transport system ATPase subunit
LLDVSFECRTGDILAIFGRNGSGKSTLFKVLFGTFKARKAEIYFDKEIIVHNSQLKNFIGIHLQDVFLPKDLKVRDIIPLFLPDGDIQNKVFHDSLINRIERTTIGKLSLGEQRYLQFLLLLYSTHHFVLLDEPFTMVEPLYRDRIKELILENRTQKGFVISDHYYQEILQIADNFKLLKNGRLSTISSPNDLISEGYLRK